MIGNPRLKELGFKEEAIGHNAIAAGFQGQRQWTDWKPNGDFSEALMCSTFDWNGIRESYVLATENDACNGVAMLFGKLLTGCGQMFLRCTYLLESRSRKTCYGQRTYRSCRQRYHTPHQLGCHDPRRNRSQYQCSRGSLYETLLGNDRCRRRGLFEKYQLVTSRSGLFPWWRLFFSFLVERRYAGYHVPPQSCKRPRPCIANCRRLDCRC